jgi:hypothetical protein
LGDRAVPVFNRDLTGCIALANRGFGAPLGSGSTSPGATSSTVVHPSGVSGRVLVGFTADTSFVIAVFC